jgi:hypothetical protein
MGPLVIHFVLCTELLITSRPMAQALQLAGEAPFLLIFEARIQRLCGIGERLLIDGSLTQESGFLAHLLDHVEGVFQLRTVGSQGDLEIGIPLADVFHGAFDGGPILRLLRREAQVSFDMGYARGELIVDLVCGKFSSFSAVTAAGRTSALRNSEYSLHATDDPALNATYDPADGASHRAGRTIAGSSAFFRAANDALSLCCQGHGKNGEDTGGNHQTKLHVRSPWTTVAQINAGTALIIHISPSHALICRKFGAH